MHLTGLLLQVTEAAKSLDQAIPSEEEAKEITMPIWDLVIQGGWVMAILGVFLIVAVFIFIERFLVLNKAAREDKNFMGNLKDYILKGKLDNARDLCKQQNSPISRMIEKGVSRIGKPLNDINAAIENVGKLEVSRLEKNIAALATISGAGPMLGFLGTVIGMIRAFYDMSMAGNNIDIVTLSSGIYQAMVTTVAGLIVGILAYICYNILVARVEKMVFLLEARATEFMDLLHEPAA
ncbi:MAG: MotA/TolQ/ExbB proton channel family protein [Bacteroidales bacterium]